MSPCKIELNVFWPWPVSGGLKELGNAIHANNFLFQ